MSVIFKDIDELSPKEVLTGEEKIAVSGTEFATVEQIAAMAEGVKVGQVIEVVGKEKPGWMDEGFLPMDFRFIRAADYPDIGIEAVPYWDYKGFQNVSSVPNAEWNRDALDNTDDRMTSHFLKGHYYNRINERSSSLSMIALYKSSDYIHWHKIDFPSGMRFVYTNNECGVALIYQYNGDYYMTEDFDSYKRLNLGSSTHDHLEAFKDGDLVVLFNNSSSTCFYAYSLDGGDTFVELSDVAALQPGKIIKVGALYYLFCRTSIYVSSDCINWNMLDVAMPYFNQMLHMTYENGQHFIVTLREGVDESGDEFQTGMFYMTEDFTTFSPLIEFDLRTTMPMFVFWADGYYYYQDVSIASDRLSIQIRRTTDFKRFEMLFEMPYDGHGNPPIVLNVTDCFIVTNQFVAFKEFAPMVLLPEMMTDVTRKYLKVK